MRVFQTFFRMFGGRSDSYSTVHIEFGRGDCDRARDGEVLGNKSFLPCAYAYELAWTYGWADPTHHGR